MSDTENKGSPAMTPITPEAAKDKTILLIAGIPQPYRRIIEKLRADKDALADLIPDLSAALVRAALERAADAVSDGIDGMSAVTAMALDSSENAIRDLAADPEAVAAIVAQVMEKE